MTYVYPSFFGDNFLKLSQHIFYHFVCTLHDIAQPNDFWLFLLNLQFKFVHTFYRIPYSLLELHVLLGNVALL